MYFPRKNDVLVARMPEPLGRATLFPGDKKDSVTVVDVCVIRPKNEDVDEKWLMYWVNTPQLRLEIFKLQSGTTRKRISRKNLSKIQFPFPQLNQQKQIVEKIEELFSHIDAGIESLKIAKEKLKQYRQSVLKAAVTGELTKDWREANKDNIEPANQLLQRILKERRQRWEQQKLAEFQAKGKPPKNDKWKEKYKEPQVPEFIGEEFFFPNSWLQTGIESIAIEIVDCLHSTAKFIDDGFYCIDTNSMSDSEILFDKARFVSEETFNDRIRRLRPKQGDILFSREGTVGKVAVVPKNVELCLGQRMMMFRFIKEVSPEFIKLFLLSPVFKKQWKVKVSGTTSPHVNISDIRKMFVLIPALGEQKEIVRIVEEKLTAADRLMAELDTKLTQAQQQKQTILASAFKGVLVL